MLFSTNISTSVHSNVNININTKLSSLCALFFLNSFNSRILFLVLRKFTYILCILYEINLGVEDLSPDTSLFSNHRASAFIHRPISSADCLQASRTLAGPRSSRSTHKLVDNSRLFSLSLSLLS